MLIAVGAVLAVVVLSDAIRTAINLSEERGPIARAVLYVGRAVTRAAPERFRGSAGVIMTLMVVLSWTLGLWLAWSIALLDPLVTVQDTATGEEVGGMDVVYVAGYAIFTLGTGDLAMADTLGRIVTVLASGTGLFTVTMEVTYLVSLTSAAAQERKTARQAYALGHDVEQVLRQAWDGSSFRSVERLLIELANELGTLAEQHRTFPVLHDVLPSHREVALGPSLLALADALEVMRHAVPREQAVGPLPYAQVTQAVDALLRGLPSDSEERDPPPVADVGPLLAELGATVVAEPELDDDDRRRRRRQLFGLAMEEGWERSAIESVSLVGS